MKLTAERARELLAYDSDTGDLRWRIRLGSRAPAGGLIDSVEPSSGYINVRLDKKLYRAHRVIWLMVRGAWPHQIDHRNRNRADNRLENIRETCDALNRQNTEKVRVDSRAGLKGVYMPRRPGGKYGARIRVADKYIWLGQFETPEAAHRAYLDAKAQVHPAWAPSEGALHGIQLTSNHLFNAGGARRVRSDSRTGVVGVYPYRDMWRARFKKKFLGTFSSTSLAEAAVRAALESHRAKQG